MTPSSPPFRPVRILLDENLPVDLAKELPGHTVDTVRALDWSGVANGELLRRTAENHEVFVTMDRNLEHQQRIQAFPFGIVVIHAASNQLKHLRPMLPELLAVFQTVRPGELVRVGA